MPRRLTLIGLSVVLLTTFGAPAFGVQAGADGDNGSIWAEVNRGPSPEPPGPTPSSGPQPVRGHSGEAASGGGSAPRAAQPAAPRHPGLTFAECVAFLEFTEDRSACEPAAPGVPAGPVGPGVTVGPPVTVVVDPAAVAESLRNEVPVAMPGAHTSPPEDGFQLTGLRTWFWLDAEAWRPTSVRAEVPGVWVEVTATPQTATWVPGDGSATVACTGPARRHPGTAGATTDCGHTYLEVGDYTVSVSVRFVVTWTASTGEGGTLEPITLTRQLPLEVQQRQVVIDG